METVIYIAEDGHTYRLTTVSGTRAILSSESTGMAPIEYITERGPFQHGETVKDYFLRPRVVQYVIRQKFCGRQEYWNGRNALLSALNPNRGVNGVLRTILPNGSKRDLTVAILEGPKFEPDDPRKWDQWAFQEVLRFVAHNPVYYDPTEKIETFGPCGSSGGFPYTFPITLNSPCEIQFPITFPITFEHFDILETLTNDGTWLDYPTITINGPAAYITVTNVTTGEVIKISGYSLLLGESITIDLAYGAKTVTKNDGTNLMPYVVSDSDLATFHIAPGNNVVRVQIGSYGVDTTVQVSWRDRFIGI